MQIIVCTNRARIELTKELNTSKIPFTFGKSMEQIVTDTENPKVKMAIRMTKERLGMQCLTIKEN